MFVSVIVPAYNAEKTIGRCIESVINQIDSDWELIIIDDGSTDATQMLVNHYVAIDTRIKYIYQTNMGAGIARNRGIQEAKGDYIVFVDSDDYIDSVYFKTLRGKHEDVVFIDAKRDDKIQNKIIQEKMSIYKSMSKDDFIKCQMTGKIPWGGWRKAVKRQVIQDNHIMYSDQKNGEECIFTYLIMRKSVTYSFIDKEVYTYEVHENSLSKSRNLDPWGNAALQLKEQIIKDNEYDKYASTLNGFFVASCIVSVVSIARDNNIISFMKLARQRIREFNEQRDEKYSIDFKHLGKKYVLTYPIMKIGLLLPFYVMGRMYK